MAPLVSEVAAIPEPEIMKDGPGEHVLLTSTAEAEEPAAEFTSEPETSYAIEGTPASLDHNLLVKSGSPDENAVNQSEIIEPRATEVEHTFFPAEVKTDVADDKASDLAPVLAAAEQLPEVASQEIIQPQSTAVLVTEDVQDNKENQIENITSSTKLEEHDRPENSEARKDFVVEEVDLTYFS